jgi:hypothetical protein
VDDLIERSLAENAANEIGLHRKVRHARPCAGHDVLAACKKDVDGRDKPGHDEEGEP